MNYCSGKGCVVRKLAALSVAIALIVLAAPLGNFATVNAASYISSSGGADGSDYTSSSALAKKLDKVFSGSVGLCSDTSFKSTVNAKLGSSVMTGSNMYYVKNNTTGALTSGWQCFIYANAVYNTLFNEYVGHAQALKHSKVVISGGNTASYSQFKNAGVKCGAYMRTTNKSNGAYNGSSGHSTIILSYSSSGITYLEGNADGHGLVRIAIRTWDDFNRSQLSGKSRYICHVVQPTDSYYNSLYPSSSSSSSSKTTAAAATKTTSKSSTPATTTASSNSSPDPSSCKVSYSRVLSLKSKVMNGSDVKYVQTCLKYLGYTVTINSKYDSTTLAAVKKFQKDLSLSVDGKCGPATWKAMESAVSSKKTSNTSAVAAATKKLSSISIKSKPSRVEYAVGDKLNTSGLALTAKYTDNSTKTITSGFTCNITTLTKKGTTKITVTYGGKTATFNVTVNDAIKIITQPVDDSAPLGKEVYFNVEATGTGLTYQWQLSDDGKNWRNSSLKTPKYCVTLTKVHNNRRVRCVVKDKYGNKVISGTATMRIK